ncbi:1641_t:CDS:2, partial [Cetraspora pellucida]
MSDLEDIDPFSDSLHFSGTLPYTLNDDSDDSFEKEEEQQLISINLNYQPEIKTQFCCQIDRDIHQGDFTIQITSAQKTTDNNGSSFITYTIKAGDQEVRRRYSEFESLRKSLMRLYPTLIVPPIPEKHSIGDPSSYLNATELLKPRIKTPTVVGRTYISQVYGNKCFL